METGSKVVREELSYAAMYGVLDAKDVDQFQEGGNHARGKHSFCQKIRVEHKPVLPWKIHFLFLFAHIPHFIVNLSKGKGSECNPSLKRSSTEKMKIALLKTIASKTYTLFIYLPECICKVP